MNTTRSLSVTLLSALLVGCGGLAPVETEREAVLPPSWMLEPCPRTAIQVSTFTDALSMLEVAEAERNECAGRLDDVREWADAESDDVQE